MSTIHAVIYGRVKDGKLIVQNRKKFDSVLRKLDGREVALTIRKPEYERTPNQNRWYWSCVVGIPADHFGYEPDEMHEAFKHMFLTFEEQGKPPRVGSTRNLTIEEFSDYVEKCRRFAAENGIVVPSPDEVEIN